MPHEHEHEVDETLLNTTVADIPHLVTSLRLVVDSWIKLRQKRRRAVKEPPPEKLTTTLLRCLLLFYEDTPEPSICPHLDESLLSLFKICYKLTKTMLKTIESVHSYQCIFSNSVCMMSAILRVYGPYNRSFIDVMDPELWNMLWKSRSLLFGSDATRRLSRSWAYIAYMHIKCCKRWTCVPTWKNTKFASVALASWYHTPEELELSGVESSGLLWGSIHEAFFCGAGMNEETMNRQFEALCSEAMAEFGPTALFVRLERDFDKVTTIDHNLLTILQFVPTVFGPLMRQPVAFPSAALIRALRRQQGAGNREVEDSIWPEATLLLCDAIGALTREEIEDLFSTYHIVGVAARGLLLVCEAPDGSRPRLRGLAVCVKFLQCLTLIAEMYQRPEGSEWFQIYHDLRADLRGEWLPGIRTICSLLAQEVVNRPVHLMLCNAWIGFGNALGLDEGSERSHRFCGYSKCRFYMRLSSHRMRRCVDCRNVCYCDRDCQRRDWEEGGHRETCDDDAD